MTVTIKIPMTLPNLNDYINAERANRYKGAAMKHDTQAVVGMYIRQQARGKHFERPVWMEYTWTEKNKRRDMDNISAFGRKVIQDALVAQKVLKNDGWENILGFSDRFQIDRERPSVTILITDEVDDNGI